MDRNHWRQLAEDRVEDARCLLDVGRWSAAYHLAGYAVECGLKACILAYIATNPEIIFRERRYSEGCWTHDIEELVKAAGLRFTRDTDVAANRLLGINWEYAKAWKEISRYQEKTEFDARRLYEAVTDDVNGVLPWVKARW